MPWYVGLIIGIVAGIAIAFVTFFLLPVFRKNSASKAASKIIRDAEIKAEHIQKNAQIDAKKAAYEAKQEADKEIKERKQEVIQQENKLLQREQSIDRRDAALISKENTLEENTLE